MSRWIASQTSFAGGIWDSRLHSRPDLEAYAISAADILNFIVTPTGMLEKRPGTSFICPTKNNSLVNLIPYSPTDELSYIIEAGDGYFRFIFDRGKVLDSDQEILECPSPYQGEDACEVEYVQKGDILVLVHPNYPPYQVSIDATGNFVCEEFPFEGEAYTTINTDTSCKLCLKGRPKGQDQGCFILSSLINIEFSPGDTITFDDGTGNIFTTTIRTILDNGSGKTERICTTWTGATYTGITIFSIGGVSAPLGVTATMNGYGNVTSPPPANQGILEAIGCPDFTPDIVGQTYLIDCAVFGITELVEVTVTAYISPTEVQTDWAGLQCPCTSVFYEQAFTEGNYPETVACFQNRLIFGNTSENPNGVWMSAVGNPYDFTQVNQDGSVSDDNAIFVELNTQGTNGTLTSAIRWLAAEQDRLVIGTESGLYTLQASRFGDRISATTLTMYFHNNYGASDIDPVMINDNILYVGRCRTQFFATFIQNNYGTLGSDKRATPIKHLADCKFKNIAYQQCPYDIVWSTTEDGALLGFSYDPRQKQSSWHRHELGGVLVDGTKCKHPDVCKIQTVSNRDRCTDDLYMVVKRTIDGEDRYYIEVLGDFWSEKSNTYHAQYVDSAIQLGPESTTPASLSGEGPVGVTLTTPLANAPALQPGDTFGYYSSDLWNVGLVTEETSPGEYLVDFVAPNNRCEDPSTGVYFCEDDDWVKFDKCDTRFNDQPVYRPPCSLEGSIQPTVETLQGLGHLVGENVQLTINGHDCYDERCAARPEDIVAEDGSLEIETEAYTATVGLPYESRVEMLPNYGGSSRGFAFCQATQIYKFCISLWCAFGGEVGSGQKNKSRKTYKDFQELKYPDDGILLEAGLPEAFTGFIEFSGEAGTVQKSEFNVQFRHRRAMPVGVRAIIGLTNTRSGN